MYFVRRFSTIEQWTERLNTSSALDWQIHVVITHLHIPAHLREHSDRQCAKDLYINPVASVCYAFATLAISDSMKQNSLVIIISFLFSFRRFVCSVRAVWVLCNCTSFNMHICVSHVHIAVGYSWWHWVWCSCSFVATKSKSFPPNPKPFRMCAQYWNWYWNKGQATTFDNVLQLTTPFEYHQLKSVQNSKHVVQNFSDWFIHTYTIQ